MTFSRTPNKTITVSLTCRYTVFCSGLKKNFEAIFRKNLFSGTFGRLIFKTFLSQDLPKKSLKRKNIFFFFFFFDITAPRQRGLSRRVTSEKGLKQKSEFIAFFEANSSRSTENTNKSSAARIAGKSA